MADHEKPNHHLPEEIDSELKLDVAKADRHAWELAAIRAGMRFDEWVATRLNAAAREDDQE